ncbi:MAG: hypothetical protein O2855_07555, partial [Planctomycetota bacterium]|nr:hypothetical protein [Planctomycetota bacterium]
GCNDDGVDCLLSDGTTPYASELGFACVAGHSYLVRNGSYADGDTGTGTLLFTLPVACSFPSSTSSEGEACGSNSNGGCDTTTGAILATPIANGAVVAGSFWADADARDTDWYSFTLDAETNVTWSVYSNQFAAAFLISGDPCTTATIVAQGSGSCPTVVSACLDAGTYYAWAGTADFTGTPCGSGALNDYVASLGFTAADCPEASDTCDNEGPDNQSSTGSMDVTGGGVACGAAGITTPNTYAMSFPAITAGEVRCLSVGFSNSGSSILGSVALYRDTDGGAPTGPDIDLELLGQRDFNLPGGYLGAITARFDEPICLDGNTMPIVAVFDIGASTDGFAVYGGNGVAGPEVYILSAACGLATFNSMSSIGFPGESWMVNINGDFAACGGGGNPCPTDLDGNGAMDGADLAILLGGWGGPDGDIDGDGTTNGADLAALLGVFGTSCP